MRFAILSVLALSLVAGCNRADDRVRFDGQIYRGKASKVKENPRQFTAWASPVSASLEGAREAARYEGIKYCVKLFGTSQIDWTASPDTENVSPLIDGETLNVAGECRP